jgi:hypothetical protein
MHAHKAACIILKLISRTLSLSLSLSLSLPLSLPRAQVYGTVWTPTPDGGGHASTTCPTCGGAYTAAYAATNVLFGVNTRDGAVAASPANKKAYIDIRGSLATPADIAKAIAAVAAAGPVANIYVASLGDEITVAGGDTSATAWTAWCATRKATAVQGCGGGKNVSTAGIIDAKGDPLSNGIYYWSEKFIHASAIGHFKTMTDQLQAGLPNCNVGANFAPTAYFTDPRDGQQYCNNYLGTTYQWVEMFRQGGMTLPWSEDWAWQSPMGSQQMVTLLIDVMRSSVIKHAAFGTDQPYASRDSNDSYTPVDMPAVPALTGSPPLMMYEGASRLCTPCAVACSQCAMRNAQCSMLTLAAGSPSACSESHMPPICHTSRSTARSARGHRVTHPIHA